MQLIATELIHSIAAPLRTSSSFVSQSDGAVAPVTSPIIVDGKPSKKAAKPNEAKGTVARADLWTVHGVQYDLRSFVASHPGGHRAISLGKGRDATELFEAYHPFSAVAKKVLAKYEYKGPIDESDGGSDSESSTASTRILDGVASDKRAVDHEPEISPFEWDTTPFLDECRAAVRKHFSPLGTETSQQVMANSKATAWAWFQHFIGICIVIPTFIAWCRGDPWAILYFPATYWLVCSDLMHNGSHFCMSMNPFVNAVCAYLGSLHAQYELWAIQHVVGHHSYTNMHGLDPDVHHFTHHTVDDMWMPGYRSHPTHAYLSKYERLWKFALVFQAGATSIAISLLNVPLYLKDRAVNVTAFNDGFAQRIKFDRTVLMLLIGIHAYFHGIIRGPLVCLVSWIVHGLIFNVFSQISHVNEASMDESEVYRKARGQKKIEWAAHQLLSATDYECDSWLWCTLSINLNAQICHHLFPSVHPCHYSAIRRLLIPIAARHGLDYNGRSSGTFSSVVHLYIKWLFALNEQSATRFGISESTMYSTVYTAGTVFVFLSWFGLSCLFA